MYQTAKLLTIFLMVSGVFAIQTASLHAQVSGQTGGDQRQQRPTGSGLMQLDFSSGLTSFYYLEEMMLNSQFPQFVQEGVIDPERYRVGPGDMLTLDFTGEFAGIMKGLLVNPNGYLAIPRIGKINLNDLTLIEASEAVEEFVQEKYKYTRLSLSIDRPRSLKVHVTGDVPYSGLHLIRPQTRLDQAIYSAFFEIPAIREQPGASPFPVFPYRYPEDFIATSGFSFRNIEVHRSDDTIFYADLVNYFHGGDLESNPIVQEGDRIRIRRTDEFAPGLSVTGAVNTARQLEYRSDDTIGTVINIAGGFSADARRDEVTIFRNTMNGVQSFTIDLTGDEAMDTELQPNDRIVIPYDYEARGNFIATINGEINMPGSFPIRDGETTLWDLMQLAGGLTDRALPHAAYMMRTNPARTEYGNRLPFNPDRILRTSDQFLQGFEYLAKEAELNRNEVFIDLSDEEQMRGVTLYSGDRIFVPRDDKTVFLLGQVRNPGYYPFTEGRSVEEYVQRAGGFTIPAEEERVFVIKAGSETWYRPHETTLQSGDVIFVDREPYDDLVASRAHEIQRRQLRNSNIQLIMTGLTTITGIITTYVAITR